MGEMRDRQQRLEQAVEEQRRQQTQYHSYVENDMFMMKGEPVFSVLDYWRYTYGALASQHDRIAEYLVSMALGIEKAENAMLWTGYDVSYKSKRVEVKATSYVHAWNKKKTSDQRTFSIATSDNHYWYGRVDRNGKQKARQNDLYVFCLNTNRDIENSDPLRIDDWDFYVIPTFRIDDRCDRLGNPDQKTISLGVVRRMAGEPVKWPGLKEKIEAVFDEIDQHVVEMDK